MRDRKEIEQAIKDYSDIPAVEFSKKYGVATLKEIEVFVKALRWVLEVNVKSEVARNE